MVPLFPSSGIGDDNICEHLGHQSVAAQIKHTVPGVAQLRLEQVVNADGIPVFSEQLHSIRVHFRLGIRDDHGLPAADTLKQGWTDYTAGFHRSAGAEHSDVLVEPGVFRQADNRTMIVLAQYDASGLAGTGYLQNGSHLPIAHPARRSVGTALAAGEIAGIPIFAAKSVLEPEKGIDTGSQDNDQKVVLEAGKGEPAHPAVQYASSERGHRCLACDAPI